MDEVVQAISVNGLPGVRRPAAAPQGTSPPAQAAPKSIRDDQPPARKVFITEQMLSGRIAAKGSAGGAIELADNEFLTPAAKDLLAARGLSVRKSARPCPPAAQSPASCLTAQPAAPAGERPVPTGSPRGTGAIGIMSEKPDAKVQAVVESLLREALPLACYNNTDCWMENLRSLCLAVASGAVASGVALMPYAADAMVLANKLPGVRAVQGTRSDSVAAAMRHFGANVLILEHALSSFHELRAMVRVFTGGQIAPGDTPLFAAISEAERK